MAFLACSSFTGPGADHLTLLVEAVSIRDTPILGTILYDDHSQFRRLRNYQPVSAKFPNVYARHIYEPELTNEFIVHRDKTIFIDSSIHTVASKGANAADILSTFEEILNKKTEEVDRSYEEVSAMLLHNEGGGTWGHFIVQNIPRALLYLEKFPNGRIIVPRSHAIFDASNFNRSLVRLGVPQDRLVGVEPAVQYKFKEIVQIDFLYDIPKQVPHPVALDLLSKGISQTPIKSEQSIFLAREPNSGRLIDNIDDVKKVLINHGINYICQGSQSFGEQVTTWQESKLVIATLGSDLTNIVFGKEGTKILALSPDHFGDQFFYNLAISRKMQWNELRCGLQVEAATIAHKASFRVDVDILDTMLSTLAA